MPGNIMCNYGGAVMSKIRVTTKKEYIVEWNDGRKIELSCGEGHESDDSLYFHSSWIELGYDEDE